MWQNNLHRLRLQTAVAILRACRRNLAARRHRAQARGLAAAREGCAGARVDDLRAARVALILNRDVVPADRGYFAVRASQRDVDAGRRDAVVAITRPLDTNRRAGGKRAALNRLASAEVLRAARRLD